VLHIEASIGKAKKAWNQKRLFMFASIQASQRRISEFVEEFLLFSEVRRGFSKETVVKYRDCLRQVQKYVGDLPAAEFSKHHLFLVEQAMLTRNLGISRRISILLALKSFFGYLKEEKQLETLSPEQIQPPKRHRKDVVFLTAEEVERFVESIKISNYRGGVYASGLRLRALVETLLGSAMRIGEALSLNRDQIDFKTAEAKIVGKGRKERTVFFTDQALHWIQAYLKTRTDDCPALFVCQDGKSRLKRTDLWRPFAKCRRLSGIRKKVTPHLLRHTAATQLLYNGCPVGYIRQILGHERLETTCRYYLGLDQRATKAAHRKYLVYGPQAA
jgi:integrase/recombinase XerD